MDENTTYTNDSMNAVEDVPQYEFDDQNQEVSDAAGGAVIGALVGSGVLAGIAIHKWVAPAVKKVAGKAKKKIVEWCTEKQPAAIEEAKTEEPSKEEETKEETK